MSILAQVDLIPLSKPLHNLFDDTICESKEMMILKHLLTLEES